MDFADAWWEVWQGSDTRPTTWRGVPFVQNPIDVYLLAEAVHRTRPSLVIESGTHRGGSALFFADMIGAPDWSVLTIDVADHRHPDVVRDPRIAFARQSSARGLTFFAATGPVMVFLDSDHSYEHVRCELDTLAPLVSPGCYLVIGDTVCPGADQAAREFLNAWPDEWDRDRDMERFGGSFHTWAIRR